jgi:TIR domain
LQQRLAVSESVVFVVSPGSVGRGWVNEEFAAAIAASVRGRQRVIPVLLGDVELPPFVAGRLYIDFRHTDSPEAYLRQVAQLVRAIRGEPSADRPQPGEPLVVPGSTAYRGEGPLPARLRIDAEEAVATTAAEEASEPVTPAAGWGAGLGRAAVAGAAGPHGGAARTTHPRQRRHHQCGRRRAGVDGHRAADRRHRPG